MKITKKDSNREEANAGTQPDTSLASRELQPDKAKLGIVNLQANT